MVTETGRITIDGVEFYPGYTFEDFKKTKVTDNNFVRFLPSNSKDITFKLKYIIYDFYGVCRYRYSV